MTRKDRILANADRYEHRGNHRAAGILRRLADEVETIVVRPG